MAKLQNKGYRIPITKIFLIVLVLGVIVAGTIMSITLFGKKEPNTTEPGTTIPATDINHALNLLSEVESRTTTLTTKKEIIQTTVAEKITEVLFIIDQGQFVLEENNNETVVKFGNKEVDSEKVSFKLGEITIVFPTEELVLDSSQSKTFINLLAKKSTDVKFSDEWNNKISLLTKKLEDIEQTPEADMIELPDTYPANFGHELIQIFAVESKTFNTEKEAADYARKALSDKAKSDNISSFIIAEGLTVSDEMKHLIYWVK